MANRLLERIQSGGSQSIPVSSNRLLKSIGSGKIQSGPLNIAEIVRRQQEEKKKREPIPGVDFTPVSEFPQEPSLLDKAKGFIFSDSDKFKGQILSAKPTAKESLIGGVKWVGKQFANLGQLPSIATEAAQRKFGDTELADAQQKLREESVLAKLSEVSEPSTPGETLASRGLDIFTIIPSIIKNSATKLLVKASTKDAVISILKKEGLTVEDSLAELIAKSKDETTIQKLLSNSNIKSASDDAESVASYLDSNGNKVFTKINNYEYNRLRDEIRNIPDAERGTNQIHLDADTSTLRDSGTEISREDFIAGHPQAQSVFSKTVSEIGDEALEKIRKAVEPEKKKPILERVVEEVKDIPTKAQEAFTTRFIRINEIEKDILKSSGSKEKPSLIKSFENFSSDKYAAASKVKNFQDDVVRGIEKSNLREELKQYLFAERTRTRLNAGIKTGDFTIQDIDAGLSALKKKVGDKAFSEIQLASKRFQEYADETLSTLESSGVISKEGAAAIRKTNDFYAPFKVMKYIEKDGGFDIGGAGGRSVNMSGQDVVKAMKGISDEEVRVADIINEMSGKIYQANVAASKNRLMQEFSKLADFKDSPIKRLRLTEKVKARISVLKDIKGLTREIKKLKRLLSNSSKWERKLKSEINKLNIKGLKFALKKEAKPLLDKKKVAIRSGKNRAIKVAEERISRIKDSIKNLQKSTSKEKKIKEDGVTFIKKEQGKLSTKERVEKLAKLKAALKKEEDKLTAIKKSGENREFVYATTSPRETRQFVEELVNLPDSTLEMIKKKISSRDKKLALVVEQIRGIKNAIEADKFKKGQLKSRADELADFERAAKSEGKEIVSYLDDGIQNILEVPKEVADSIKGLNVNSMGVVTRGMRWAMIPARAGITTYNIGFMLANALIDFARTASISKFRISNPKDAGLFVYDYTRAFIDSIGGNFDDVIKKATGGKISTKSKTYKAAESEGIFSGTYHNVMKEYGKPDGSVFNKANKVLDIFDKPGNAIEEMSKLAGYRRGQRLLKEGKISQKDLLYEIRNYSGSPDFARGGTMTPEANVLFMFFNARIQGIASDLSRLSGYSDGGKEAAKAWTSLASLIGIPVTVNSIINNTMYQDDMDKLTDWERANNIIIFKNSFIKDEDGEYILDAEGKPIRDAWKIPVRDTVGAVKNMTEAVIDTAYREKSMKDSMIDFASKTVEGFSPVNIQGNNLEEKTQSMVSSANPLIKSFYEVSTGIDPYRHRPIEPDYLGGEITSELPKEFRKKDSTPSWAISLGELTGQSPLVIEKIANDFGAGVFTQFKGTDDRGNALSRRFIRSVYYKENEDFIEEMDKLNEADAIQGIQDYAKAKVIYESVKDLEAGERKEILSKMKESGELTKGIYDKLTAIRDKSKFQYSKEDAKMRGLGVETGARAKAIYSKAKDMQPEERKKYLSDLKEKKILTERVYKQVMELKNK